MLRHQKLYTNPEIMSEVSRESCLCMSHSTAVAEIVSQSLQMCFDTYHSEALRQLKLFDPHALIAFLDDNLNQMTYAQTPEEGKTLTHNVDSLSSLVLPYKKANP